MLKAIIFDWGDTLMRDDPQMPGPMYSWPEVSWVPGAQKVLEFLKDRVCLIVATNAGASDTQAMIKAMQRVGADVYFSHFFSSKDLGFSKPDPAFFRSILSATGFSAEETAMAGNAYDKDIEGAKAAGLITVWFDEAGKLKPHPDADFRVTVMEDIILIYPELVSLAEKKQKGRT